MQHHPEEADVRTLIIVALGISLLSACSPSARIDKASTFVPVPAEDTILVLPVESIMCPADVSEAFFDRLVDELNRLGSAHGYSFAILKQDPASLPSRALDRKVYLSGEIYGCLEDFGCCSGEVTMTVRLELFQPGVDTPTLSQRYPVERFFDLEQTTPDAARTLLARQTADQAASDLIEAFLGGH